MEPRLLAALSLTLLAFGAVSRRAESSPVTPPMVFVALGLLLGSGGLGWVELAIDGSVVHSLAELTLVFVLFADAARIDLGCLRRERGLPLRLLGLGLPLTIAAGALAAKALFPEFGAADALLLAAILAPTDAALGQAVVSSPLVPLRIRQSLNVESGLNDGIVLPVVLIFASIAGMSHGSPSATGWIGFVIAQVTLGPAVGALVGWLGGRVIGAATEAGWVNDAFEQLASLGIALLAFAGAELVHGNGFIAAFVAGLTLGSTARGVCKSLYEFGEAEGQLLTLLVFLVFGATLAPAALARADSSVVFYAIASLTVVRMIPVALSLIGSGLLPVSHAFLGWFGPRGLASILFALLILEDEAVSSAERIESVVSVVVLLSTVAHGLTAYPLAGLYASRVERSRAGDAVEHSQVTDHPVRIRHSPRAESSV